MNLTKKQEQLVMVGLGSAMLIVVAYMFIITPQSEKRAEAKGTIDKFVEKKEAADKILAKETEFTADMDAIRARLDKVEDQMADGDLYLWVNLLLQKFKAKYGFGVDIPSVGRERRIPIGTIPDFPYEAASFALSGTGHFHDIGAYVRTLENDFPFVRIQNLVLMPAGDKSEKLELRMELVALIKPVREEEEESE